MDPITSYLKDKKVLDNKDEARKIRLRSARYVILRDVLCKRGYSLPYLRCLTSDEANYIMREIHEGICGNHSVARSLVHKTIHQEYFWPTMKEDAHKFMQLYDKCQYIKSTPRTTDFNF